MIRTCLALWFAVLAGLVVMGCSSTPYSLAASGPYLYPQNWAYPTDSNSSLDRIAILITVRNISGDDLAVNPTDFLVRDSQHRVYAADPTATTSPDSLTTRPAEIRDSLPLPTLTLRGNDVVSGYVVFDVPAGVRPVELVWRQSDSDTVATLSATR